MIRTIETPEISPIQIGASFKVLKITGRAGMYLPTHRSTKEVVVVAQKGRGLLRIGGDAHLLEPGVPYLIPAGTYHSLSIIADFSAVAIMDVHSSIEFE